MAGFSCLTACASARRASASSGRDLAVVAVPLGPIGVPDRQDAGDQRQREKDADSGHRTTQTVAGTCVPRPAVDSAARCSIEARATEASRNAASVSVRSGEARSRHSATPAQPGPAVELAVRTTHRVPGIGGAGKVPEQPLAVHVVVEPATQPGPDPHEGLVRDLERVPVDGDQPGVDQLLDEPRVGDVRGDLVARQSGADRVAVVGGRDQPQHQPAKLGPPSGVHGVVQGLGGLGDRLPDPAGGPVAGHGQGRALAAFPGLAQHVREQRQRGRLALDLADQQVDQTGLEPETGASGRPLDRAAELRLAHRPQQVHALLEHAREARVRRQVTEVVGAQRDDQRTTGTDMLDQSGEEPLPLGRRRRRR